MSTSSALIPVIAWVFMNAATALLLAIPVRKRLYALPAILIPATVSFRTMQHLRFIPGLAELWGTITLVAVIHFVSLLYIKKWSLRTTSKPLKVSQIIDTWLNRRCWTQLYKIATNPRFVRVRYKDVITSNKVKSTAIHRKYSRTRILWLLFKIGLYFLFNTVAIIQLVDLASIDSFTPAKSVFLRRLVRSILSHPTDPVSTNEILMRIWFAMITIWTPVLVLDSLHLTLAILFIHVLRIDIPDEWPDLFGSPLEAFSLGRFWTVFWHRLHLSGYSDFANLVLSRRILRNTAIKRVAMTFFLFLTTGVIHQLSSRQLDPGCRDYADLQFFTMNAAAVCGESTLVQFVSPRRLSGDSRRAGVERMTFWGWLKAALVRFLGYFWVVSFFVWAAPNCYYSRVYCAINHL